MLRVIFKHLLLHLLLYFETKHCVYNFIMLEKYIIYRIYIYIYIVCYKKIGTFKDKKDIYLQLDIKFFRDCNTFSFS